MVFDSTLNNISVVSWRLVFAGGEEYPENTTDIVASHWQTLSHNVVSSTPQHDRVWTLVVIGMTMTAPQYFIKMSFMSMHVLLDRFL